MAKQFRLSIVFIFVMAFCFAMISPLSFADFQLSDAPSGVSDSFNFGSSSFRALMASILAACNITIQSTLPVVAPVEDILINPFNITDTVMDYIEYSYPWLPDSASVSPRESLAEYMSREGTLVVRGDDVVIDGKHYTDIWLDNDAAQAMRTNVLDLETAWNIASNSSGIFVSGVGTVAGVPVYDLGSSVRSSDYLIPIGSSSVGDVVFSTRASGSNYYFTYTYQSSTSQIGYLPSSDFPVTVYFTGTRPSGGGLSPGHGYLHARNRTYTLDSAAVSQPFDFSYVSQTIPADVLPSDQGLSIRVPNDPTEWDDPVVQQNITNFNNNMTFSPNVEISLGDPGIMDTLDTVLTGIGDLILLLKPTLAPSPLSPVDPTVIANTPWVQLQTRLDAILAHLQSILDAIVAQNSFLAQFQASVVSGFASVVSSISSIASQIGDIASSVVNGDKKWYKEVVDSIKAPFLPILQSLASITGIWRYVVSWFGNVSTPFTFFFSALGSAGAYFLSPFFALAAGCIVIAIYRRFGK